MSDLRVTQVNVAADVVDFGIGQPGFDLLPAAILRRAAERRLDGVDTSFLNYGMEQGDAFLRLALARFLSEAYALPVTLDELFITSGASQGLDLICTLYTGRGDVIFVEEPSYFLALRIFADHGLHVISIPTDGDGLIIEALEEALVEVRPVFLYTIPTYQNPTGATLSEERRRQLVALSEAHGFLIVADEVYHLLSYTVPPPPPLAAYRTSGRVLSVGSFSKILAPGLRLGWIAATPALAERFALSGLADSGGGLNPFASALVRVVLEEGWQADYLATLGRVYGARVEVLDAALHSVLGERIIYRKPAGGFFFWLRLRGALDAQTLLATAAAHKVGFQPGIRFSSRGALRDCLRLSFAFYAEERLQEGVARLAHALGQQ